MAMTADSLPLQDKEGARLDKESLNLRNVASFGIAMLLVGGLGYALQSGALSSVKWFQNGSVVVFEGMNIGQTEEGPQTVQTEFAPFNLADLFRGNIQALEQQRMMANGSVVPTETGFSSEGIHWLEPYEDDTDQPAS